MYTMCVTPSFSFSVLLSFWNDAFRCLFFFFLSPIIEEYFVSVGPQKMWTIKRHDAGGTVMKYKA